MPILALSPIVPSLWKTLLCPSLSMYNKVCALAAITNTHTSFRCNRWYPPLVDELAVSSQLGKVPLDGNFQFQIFWEYLNNCTEMISYKCLICCFVSNILHFVILYICPSNSKTFAWSNYVIKRTDPLCSAFYLLMVWTKDVATGSLSGLDSFTSYYLSECQI